VGDNRGYFRKSSLLNVVKTATCGKTITTNFLRTTCGMKFNELLKSLRVRRRITLRQCAADLGVDASNWSKIERGVNPAPRDVGVLKGWADYFGLRGVEEAEFFDSAALSRNEIPTDLASDERIMGALPAFFRSLRDSDMSDKKLEEFISDLRKLHTPDPDPDF
jgi:transcriptional regulator with XRE-family HTH domain